jgi:hypothetical protein
MHTPHVESNSIGTAHPVSARKAVARGHHNIERRIKEARQRSRSTTLYQHGTVTVAGIDYQQRMMPVLYGPGHLNSDMN